MIPQIIWLTFTFISFLMSANLHGKEKKGKNNFWVDLIFKGLGLSLLYWGGFFDNIF